MVGVVCPYCKEGLEQDPTIRCIQCQTRHHKVCWLENESHCAVFSCEGQNAARIRSQGNVLLILWCLLNYALHLTLRFIGELTEPIPLADMWIVIILEAAILVTGGLVIRSRTSSEAFRTFGLLLFACNALFLSLLASHSIAYGFERLNALIRL